MLNVSPLATPVWPLPGDAAELLAVVTAQAVTMTDQFAVLHDYQDALDAAQATTPKPQATGTGTASGTPATTLTVTGVTNTIVIGAIVAGAGVPTTPQTTITAQQSGTTGTNGVYTTSAPTTANGNALTFTPPPPPATWPLVQDAPTLVLLVQNQTSALRTMTTLIQNYLDILNTSQTPAS
jgi:hypothetical protein